MADVGFLVKAGGLALNRGRASDPIRTVRGASYSFDERFGRTA